MKVDVSIYGNLVLDTVFDGFNKKQTLGGIANVWNAFQTLESDLNVDVIPVCIGSAIIYIDSNTGLKISKPNLQSKYQQPNLTESSWAHIAYINQLSDVSFIKNIKSKFISADLAGKGAFDYDILSMIDYLFISEDEVVNLNKILQLVRGYTIVHNASGSTLYYKTDKLKTTTHEIITNVNVLGAGDYFAASFINIRLLNTKIAIHDCIDIAHSQTLNYLRKYAK
jgi:hypothetical protein